MNWNEKGRYIVGVGSIVDSNSSYLNGGRKHLGREDYMNCNLVEYNRDLYGSVRT